MLSHHPAARFLRPTEPTLRFSKGGRLKEKRALLYRYHAGLRREQDGPAV